MSDVNMDTLTEGEVLPEVQEHAVAAVMNAEERASDAEAVDDAPHGRKADGTPKKKRGRKPGSTRPFNAGENAQHSAQPPQEAPLAVSSRAAAEMASGTIEAATIALISKAWRLEKDEREQNIAAWEASFNHYGGVTLSPPLMLVASHLQIVMKRAMSDSETKSRASLALAWVKHKFVRRRRDAVPEEYAE